MIMIMISYNVLQKRLIFQKYKKMFSRKIRHDAIRSGSIRWISIRFDATSSQQRNPIVELEISIMSEIVVLLYNFYIHLIKSVSDNRITARNVRQLNQFDKFHKFRSQISIENKASLCKHCSYINWSSFFSVKDFFYTFHRSERLGIHVRLTCL